MIQLGRSIFGPLPLRMENILPLKLLDWIVNSYVKELKNTDPKKLKNKGIADLLIVTGLNIHGKKIKKEISFIKGSGQTLAKNDIKDVMKVIKSFKIDEIYWKELVKKLVVKKENFSIFFDINNNCFTINEKYTYAIR